MKSNYDKEDNLQESRLYIRKGKTLKRIASLMLVISFLSNCNNHNSTFIEDDFKVLRWYWKDNEGQFLNMNFSPANSKFSHYVTLTYGNEKILTFPLRTFEVIDKKILLIKDDDEKTLFQLEFLFRNKNSITVLKKEKVSDNLLPKVNTMTFTHKK